MIKFDFDPSLIVYDFDGVMTDNRVFVDEDGKESVRVNRGDGYGVRMIKDMLNIPQVILSTEENPIVVKRAEKLRIPVIHNAGDSKESILRGYCEDNAYDLSEVLYIGNDLNDLEAMTLCGYKTCPADAEPEIIELADYVFEKNSGCGVVRELYRLLSERNNG